MRKLVLVALLAAATLAGAALAAGAAPAGPPGGLDPSRPLRFPRDHYPHAGAGVEWWYYTGIVRDEGSTRYAYFFTLFGSGNTFLALGNVVDLDSGATVGHSEQVGFGRVPAGRLDLQVAGARLRYAGGAFTFAVGSGEFALSLIERPLKAYVPNGDGGYIQQSSAGPSAYYSATRMAATGTMRAGGRTLRVTGDGWMDRQWGAYQTQPSAAFNYDWFSCRFGDSTELMLYRFRDAAGTVLDRYLTGTYVRADGSHTLVTAFRATPLLRSFRPPGGGQRFPLAWRVEVPSLGLAFTVDAFVADQLVRTNTVPPFWEGAAAVRGPKGGYCFVEQTYR